MDGKRQEDKRQQEKRRKNSEKKKTDEKKIDWKENKINEKRKTLINNQNSNIKVVTQSNYHLNINLEVCVSLFALL